MSYVLGRDAERDLDDLWDFAAARSVESAYRLIKQFFEAFEDLARNHGMGHRREDLTTVPVLFLPVAVGAHLKT